MIYFHTPDVTCQHHDTVTCYDVIFIGLCNGRNIIEPITRFETIYPHLLQLTCDAVVLNSIKTERVYACISLAYGYKLVDWEPGEMHSTFQKNQVDHLE